MNIENPPNKYGPIPNDPYLVLGVTSNNTRKEIEEAYRKLAIKYHTDNSGGDNTWFVAITEARDVLLHPKKNNKKNTNFRGFGAPPGGAYRQQTKQEREQEDADKAQRKENAKDTARETNQTQKEDENKKRREAAARANEQARQESERVARETAERVAKEAQEKQAKQEEERRKQDAERVAREAAAEQAKQEEERAAREASERAAEQTKREDENPEEIKKFIEEFNLKSLLPKEFFDLDNEQKLKVLQDLKRRIVDLVKTGAQTQYSENVKQREDDLLNGGKGFWESLHKIAAKLGDIALKESDLKKLENETFERLKKNDAAFIVQELKILTSRTREQKIDSSLNVLYLNDDNYKFGANETTELEAANNFNLKANIFANLPYEWGQEKSGKNKKFYDKAKFEYEKIRNEILVIISTRVGLEQAIIEISQLDNMVLSEQLLNTHPEYEKALNDFAEGSGGFELIKNGKKFIESVTLERAALAAGGAAARWGTKSLAMLSGATAGTAAFIAAPVVGAAVGAWRGKMRAEITLQERQKAARHGQKDENKEKAKIIDVVRLTKGLNKMIGEVEKTNLSSEEESKKIAKLSILIDYTQDQIEKGQVNFGDSKSTLVNQFELINILNKAVILKTTNVRKISFELEQRVNDLIKLGDKKRAEEISKKQKEFIKKQVIKGAKYGASFATAGYAVRWMGEQVGLFGHHTATEARTTETNRSLSEDQGEPEASDVEKNTPNIQKPVMTTPKITTEIHEASVTFEHGHGAIRGISDLQKEILGKYDNDIEKVPAKFHDFVKDNPTKIAIKLGLFKPNEVADSALIHEGSVIKFDESGISLHDPVTKETSILIDGGGASQHTELNMVDSHKHIPQENVVHEQETIKHLHSNEHDDSGREEIIEKTPEKILEETTARNKVIAEFEKETSIDQEIEKIKNPEPELKINSEVIPTAGIMQAMSMHEHNIEHLFPGKKIEEWETLKDFKAKDWVRGGEWSEDSEPFLKYLTKLINTTGLKPKNDWLIFPETIESYVERALTEAAKMGKLDEVKLE